MLIRTISIATATFPRLTRFCQHASPKGLFKLFSRSLSDSIMDQRMVSDRFIRVAKSFKTSGYPSSNVDALEPLRAHLAEDPDTVIPRCLHMIGQGLLDTGEHQRAVSYFEQAIAIHRELHGKRAEFFVSYIFTSLEKAYAALENEEEVQRCQREKNAIITARSLVRPTVPIPVQIVRRFSTKKPRPTIVVKGASIADALQSLGKELDQVGRVEEANRTPLMQAIIDNKKEEVISLIDKGVEIECVDENGNTAFHFACEGHDAEIVELLAKRVSSFKKKNCQGKTPIDLAIARKDKKILNVLFSVIGKVKNEDLFEEFMSVFTALDIKPKSSKRGTEYPGWQASDLKKEGFFDDEI